MQFTPLAVLALALAAAPLAQDDSVPYRPQRETHVLRFFGLKGDIDRADLDSACEEAGVTVVHGPVGADSRPGRTFVAVHAPADASARDVARVLSKGGAKVEELACVAFEGRSQQDAELPGLGMGLSTRDFILGMSGDIRWYDSLAGRAQFYGPVGKLKAREIQDRYQKLYEPFGGGTVGAVVREHFTWPLAREVDERAARKLEKKVGKLDGVVSATITGAELAVEVELEQIVVSNPALPFPLPSEGDGAQPAASAREEAAALPRATASTLELWDLLAAEELVAAGATGG